MGISKKNMELMIKEVDFAIIKMEKSNTLEEKLYYFSSVFGMIQRIYNIEYDEDLVYAHFILRKAYEMFQARLSAIKTGERIIPLFEDQSKKLVQYTKELSKILQEKKDLSHTLKKFTILAYSTTGNGYYLFQKGLLKI